MRGWLPRLGGVAGLASAAEGVVTGERDGLKIFGVAADALFARPSELCWLVAVAPEALYVIFGAGNVAICGGARMGARELPPRVFDASVAPRALRVTHAARLGSRASMRRPSRGLELRLVASHAPERAVMAIAAVNGAWSILMARDQ